MDIVITPLANIAANDTDDNSRINLLDHFDDPLTTGLVARFELYDTFLAGGIKEVVLFDQAGAGAPQTVQNFQTYVTSGAYQDSFIHRSVTDFVVQGGGYTIDGFDISSIPTNDPVQNEFSADRSNLEGTIAMAKVDGDPDSATNQWFFNLVDNSENLDSQNGGFTVFGEVRDSESLAVVDAIANLTIVNASTAIAPAFSNLPLITDDPNNPVITGPENLVRYRDISVSAEDELNFRVVSNTNPAIVEATINDNNRLVLDYIPDQSGTAEITIRATSLLGETATQTFTVTVTDTTENDDTDEDLTNQRGTSGNDRLRGTLDNDVLRGLGGNDILVGRPGNDRLVGGAGSDRIRAQDGRDVLLGGNGGDRLLGGNGNDKLRGQGGADFLSGQAGNDRLFGGNRNDRLFGGEGNDVLVGGRGRDRFEFRQGDGRDIVRDFEDRKDKIKLRGRFNFDDLTIRGNRNRTVLRDEDGVLAVLRGTDVALISERDFL